MKKEATGLLENAMKEFPGDENLEDVLNGFIQNENIFYNGVPFFADGLALMPTKTPSPIIKQPSRQIEFGV